MQQDKELIIIVNKHDEIVDHKERNLVLPHEFNRSSGLWITNSKGEVLLGKRAHTKRFNPGKWDAAVGGTNAKGETYLSNIIKEAKEEIGVEIKRPLSHTKVRFTSEFHFFCQWFTTTINLPLTAFTKQDEEVEELAWIHHQDIINNLRAHPEIFSEEMDVWADIFLSTEFSRHRGDSILFFQGTS